MEPGGIDGEVCGEDYGVIGDGGFTFNRVEDAQTIIGCTTLKNVGQFKLTEEESKFNKKIASRRVKIEF